MTIMKTLKRWWHQLSSPHYFNKIAAICAPVFWMAALLLLVLGFVWGLFFAPPDYQQKDAFRIIYVHVPSAFLSMAVYVSMAVAGLIYYVWHIKLAAYYNRGMVLLGALFTVLALFTGAVWGKPMWGTYWSWRDPRLLAELLLLFLYLGYWSLTITIERKAFADKMGAILLVVGVINIPIIHYSVVWWNSLHQGATIMKLGKPSIDASMLWPLLICLLGFLCFTIAYGFAATRYQMIAANNEKRWLERLYS
ncbi:heme ABC transporter permease CcmC [Ostreibacterium oceani]|uniref:Heme exporter protein C n=1 Tax=Ostreibacterium oceani TaxID=2654998 RepID=A0A6N7EZT0_9GAMM|nr:heme ABC transporter permease CcmC [Ostreibacterium oceani]MPV86018.1 hypothetical protein [Ostreibacterium oceani]